MDGLFTWFVAAVPMEEFGKSGTWRSTEDSMVKFALSKDCSVSMVDVRIRGIFVEQGCARLLNEPGISGSLSVHWALEFSINKIILIVASHARMFWVLLIISSFRSLAQSYLGLSLKKSHLLYLWFCLQCNLMISFSFSLHTFFGEKINK